MPLQLVCFQQLFALLFVFLLRLLLVLPQRWFERFFTACDAWAARGFLASSTLLLVALRASTWRPWPCAWGAGSLPEVPGVMRQVVVLMPLPGVPGLVQAGVASVLVHVCVHL